MSAGLIIVPAVFMLVTLPICPESPKHILIKKGKDVAAQKGEYNKNFDTL